MASVKGRLRQLVHGAEVEILLGSGTLANDVVAGQLSLEKGPGLVLSNGEFGDRLIDHARRFRLSFDSVRQEWGSVLDASAAAELLSRRPCDWLWITVCETSTGVLNEAGVFKKLCARRGVKLCLDCVSALGNVPLDFRGVYLASAVSGKGLGSVAGLSMVFYDHPVRSQPDRLPRYLDLGFYAEQGGNPFTQSSNLLAALRTALAAYDGAPPYQEKREVSRRLREELRRMGFQLVASEADACPTVATIALPASASGEQIGDWLHDSGLLISYQSEYLRRRNWVQICLMGDCSQGALAALLGKLERFAPSSRRAAAAAGRSNGRG